MAGDFLHKDPARPLRVALVYPRLWRQVRSFLPPLGLVSLATVARAAGHEVRIFDPSFDRTPRRIKGQLRRFDPEVVGLSVSSDLYPLAQELCAFARRLGARTVMGGPHATICAEEVLAQTRDLDVVLAGEGENTLPALLAAWASGDDPAGLPGVISRRGEEVTAGPPAEWTQDLDSLPLPDRSLLPTNRIYSGSGYTGLILTRGCPYRCAFCQPALKQVAGGFRKKSAAAVAAEIEALHRAEGNTRFHVDDDLFIMHRGWIREITAELEARGLLGKVRFIVLSRADMFDEELALLLRRLGAYYVMFGVESGCQRLLDGMDKRTTPEHVERAFALAKAHGLMTHAFLILGSPDETPESLRRTEALVRRINPTSLFISQYAPLPGTALRARMEQEGRLNITSYEQLSYFAWRGPDLPIRIPGLDRAQVVAARDRIIRGRRLGFMAPNLRELVRVSLEKRSLAPAGLHARFFLKKRHFAG